MSTSLAAAPFGANLILGLYILVATVGLVFGYFTVRGSGINNHPSDGRGAAPGSKLPDEFHQFADRQIHDADLRRAETERRVEARLAQIPADAYEPKPHRARDVHLPWTHHEDRISAARSSSDDMSIEDVNRRLAAEASARKGAKVEQQERSETR